jgi:hypothetical protein
MLKHRNPSLVVSATSPTNPAHGGCTAVSGPSKAYVPISYQPCHQGSLLFEAVHTVMKQPIVAGASKFLKMQKTIVWILALCLATSTTHALSDVKVFTIAGNVLELDLTDSTEKGIVKVPIEIWSGDQKITTIETGPKGKYKVDLAYYPSYTLRFGASPYVTKVIEIQTDGVHRAAEFGIVNLDLDITLFRDQNYMGLDFLNYTPVAKASFNKKKGQLVWDYTYGDAMNSRVRGVIEANKK